jgi:hypothetical protein
MGGEKDSPEWDFCRKHQRERERDKGERKHKGEEMRKG